jgi:hypothetical protein
MSLLDNARVGEKLRFADNPASFTAQIRPQGSTMLLDQLKTWTPSTKTEKDAVLQQLERLLQNPHFHKSKRFPVFLRFVVTEVLAGRAERLRERTLGIEIFGKDPNYDTTEDPIVRVTAGEIRKRIAQYYQEPGHEQEIRLFLPSGSYAPQFYPPEEIVPTVAERPKPPAVEEISLPDAVASRRLPKWYVALLAVLILAGVVGSRLSRPAPIDVFWAPFYKGPDPILFCVADQNQYSTIVLRDAADPRHQMTLNDRMDAVIIDDLSPLVNIASMLSAHGRTFRVQGESVTSFGDLRQAPAVFIGAFDNGWTLRFTAPLRYHFANNSEMSQFWVEDRQRPGGREWLLDRSQQATGTYKDFAIVTRALDPNTGRYVVVAAGIARGGTIASGEFLVDPRHMDELMGVAPKDWGHKNMEIVLETQVIDGRSGPPRIAAVYVW